LWRDNDGDDSYLAAREAHRKPKKNAHIIWRREDFRFLANSRIIAVSERRLYLIFLATVVVSDQLRAGEISLFENDPEEAEAAKAKLEAQRKKRRERYAKNKDRINAKRQAAYRKDG